MFSRVIMQVAIEVPSIKATLSDREYQLITSIAGNNFSEPQRLPPAALWLERYYQPAEPSSNRYKHPHSVIHPAARDSSYVIVCEQNKDRPPYHKHSVHGIIFTAGVLQ